MGSSLQDIAQIDISAGSGTSGIGGMCGSGGWLGWLGVWRCTPADHMTLTNNPTATYTIESSGVGLAEFGNAASSSCTSTTGVLSPACDPTANGQTTPELDATIGTDDPPNSGDLAAAATAAGAGVKEVTVPVAQAPVAMLFSLPSGITMGTGGQLKLKTSVLANLWGAGGVSASSKCPGSTGDTWCDLLEAAGLKRITSGTPSSAQFLDTTGNNGGLITLMERSKGSGTTFSFRGYLYEADQWLGLGDYPYSLVTDGPADWPATSETQSQTGPLGANGSGGTLVENTTESPGSTGYANLADAALDTVASYTNKVSTTDCGGACASHQILYALVQNNTGDGLAPVYENPSAATAGTVNVYTGADIAINPSTCTPPASTHLVGCWVVPSTPTGTWSSTNAAAPGTIPSDPDVYDHGISGTTPSKAYPIVAATYDVGWSQYDKAGSNLVTANGGLGFYHDTSCLGGNCNTAAGNTAKSLLSYIVGAGQGNIASGKVDYGKLPSAILAKAKAAVGSIKP
jgi:hypothetical protein